MDISLNGSGLKLVVSRNIIRIGWDSDLFPPNRVFNGKSLDGRAEKLFSLLLRAERRVWKVLEK